MPSIIIREEDNTTAGFGGSTNYTVVVPGFVSAETLEAFNSIADDSGICELSTQADFIKYVGKVGSAKSIVRTFATPEIFEPVEDAGDDLLKELGIETTLTGEQFYATYADQVYVATALAEAPAEGKGRLYLRITTGTEDVPNPRYFQLTPAASPENPDTWDRNAFYVVVLKGNEGQDEDAGTLIVHYGNQMAFELLGMGYPVMYKRIAESLSELELPEFWEPLADRSNYDFRFLTTGMLSKCDLANNQIIALAERRGDCLALADVDADLYMPADIASSTSKTIAAISKGANNITASKYAAVFAPALCYNMAEDTVYQNMLFPAHFHYLACFSHSIQAGYSEWYAAAGLTRGISNYSVAGTEVKLGEIAEHALEPRYQVSYIDPTTGIATALNKAVNIIEKIRNGYFLYGNRTAFALTGTDESTGDLVASHFLNIRHTCITLNKTIYQACRRLTFNPNGGLLWVDFCNAIRPTLETMKGDQGIADYEIVRVASSQKAKLVARVRIVPIEAVEDFDITISLEDSLGATTVTISE